MTNGHDCYDDDSDGIPKVLSYWLIVNLHILIDMCLSYLMCHEDNEYNLLCTSTSYKAYFYWQTCGPMDANYNDDGFVLSCYHASICKILNRLLHIGRCECQSAFLFR